MKLSIRRNSGLLNFEINLTYSLNGREADNSYPVNLCGLGTAVYKLDKELNRFIDHIGLSFKTTSGGLRRFLHTGHWRQYALIIFFALISLVLLGFILIRN